MTIKQIITALITNNDLDGETMQYIIESIGMRDQMLRQLVVSYIQPVEALHSR